jgi:hypothetical protein
MNDAERLYSSIQQRLAEDGLLRSAVKRVRGEAALDAVEADFIHWREDTEFPQFINGLTASIGERVK